MAGKKRGYDREEMRKQLEERKKAGEQRKPGGNFKTFLVCPDDVQIYKPGTDGEDHWIDILVYQAGTRDPLRKDGEWTHCLDVDVHLNVGVDNDQFVCPSQYNKRCPICDERKSLYEDGDKDRADKLWPSRRTVYNIICYDNDAETEKGVQIFPVAYKYLEEPIQKLAAKAKRKGEDDIDPNILIADPEEGRTVSFNVDTKTVPINDKPIKMPEYSSYELEKRDYVISEEELNDCWALDSFLYLGEENQDAEEIDWKAFYDEIYEAFYDEEVDDNKKEKETPKEEKKSSSRSRSRGSKKEEEEEEEEESHDKDDCPGEFGVDTGTYSECEKCADFEDCAVAKGEKKNSKEKKEEKSTGRSRSRGSKKEEKPTGRSRRKKID